MDASGLVPDRRDRCPGLSRHQPLLAAAKAHDAERLLAPCVREPTLLCVLNDEAIAGYDADAGFAISSLWQKRPEG